MLPALLTAKDIDLDAEVIDRQFQILELGEADGVFLGGEDGIDVPPDAAPDEARNFAGGKAVVIGKVPGKLDLRAEVAQGFLKAVGLGDGGDGGDIPPLQELQRELRAVVNVLEELRPMGALDDLGGAVVLADAGDEIGVALAGYALGDEDIGGAPEVGWRLAQGASRKEMIVPERGLTVDEDNVETVLEPKVLQAVIKEQGVAPHLFDRIKAAFDPVFVDEDDDVLQVLREHVWLVPGEPGIKEHFLAIGNDPGDELLLRPEAVHQALEQRRLFALVAPAEDGDFPPAILKRPGKFLDDGGLPCAADGQVPDGDDETAELTVANNPFPVKPEAQLYDAAVDPRQPAEKPAEDGCPLPAALAEDDLDRKLLKLIQPAAHNSGNLTRLFPEHNAFVIGLGHEYPTGHTFRQRPAHGFADGFGLLQGEAGDGGA